MLYSMKEIIHFIITQEDGWYTASCTEFFIVTQAKTLDELIKNIHEATGLYMDSESFQEKELVKSPVISVNFEFPQLA